jgi:uncharacterized repeat protein (TIGR01451 family)
MIRNDIQKKHTILIAAILLIALLLTATTPASAVPPLSPCIEVNKTVYDPDSGEWVKALTAELNDTVRFNCTIHNCGNVNLSEIRFWDILDCSLEYEAESGWVTTNGWQGFLELEFLDFPEHPFKPEVRHPFEEWNLSDPLGSETYFYALCSDAYEGYIDYWVDHNHDGNVSAGDQIAIYSGGPYYYYRYYVERVPYTLNLSNANGAMYFDSVLNWTEVDPTDPTGTKWLEVCGCRDWYNLTAWYDTNATGDLNANDTLLLQNTRTGEVAQYTVEEVAIDLVVSREYAMDRILYGGDADFILEPDQTITIEYNATVVKCGVDNNTFRAKGDSDSSAEGENWIYSNEDKVTITVPCLDVDKTVWNGTAWIKELTAKMNDTLRFKCTMHNSGEVNLTNVRFWDILDCSLNYSGNATLTNASGVEEEIPAPPCPPSYCFKAQVLHPNNLSWDPYKPLLTPPYERFTELCPDTGHNHTLRTLVDNGDGRISACDQLYLESYSEWYHVENVPYTLLVNNTETGESMYIESVLDYESATLSAPNGTEWLKVCGCKDRYTLLDWQDIANTNGHLSVGDLVTLQNERTWEEVQYTVEEVTIDLVVSKEWQIDWLPDPYNPRTLEPSQSITFEYNATVVRCGVDNNTFRAKGYYDGSWYYSNEDKVTVTVPCAAPSGEATDDGGASKEVYLVTEDVYGTGYGFPPFKLVDIYIVDVLPLVDGQPIPTPIYAKAEDVMTNGNGTVGPVLVWDNPKPGWYLIIFDDDQGTWYQSEDASDLLEVRGAAVPLVTPLGLAALIGLLCIVAIGTIARLRKKS